ncbi:MAG: hypothetical protein SNH01_02775 [Rikenellaceae bacterium]
MISHPLIAPVQITHSDSISHGSSSQNVLHLTLHLPSGVDAQISNIEISQISTLLTSLLSCSH